MAVSENGQVIWITGLSGAGKTTLAEALWPLLPKPNIWYDGDALRWVLEPIRAGMKPDEIYSQRERLRGSYLASRLYKLNADQGLTVLCSTVTMFHEIQKWNRDNISGYFEVFLDMPKEVLLARDYKNVYRQKSSPVVGLEIPPEAPQNPEMHITDPGLTPLELAQLVIRALKGDD